jgi:hypothetical protein
VVCLVEGVWQALCLLATSWRKRPCWGNAAHPQSPWKDHSKRHRFEPKKGTGNVSISVPFLARSSRFFRRWRRKKMALYALSFFGSWSEKRQAHYKKKIEIHFFKSGFLSFVVRPSRPNNDFFCVIIHRINDPVLNI